MKYTLKNRPRPKAKMSYNMGTRYELCNTIKSIEEWFDNFEKQMRELEYYWKNESKQTGRFIIANFIREILGEKE